ncbi:hypothetical protein [Kitasatospora sp. NBC_00315]|uniref:hypothetical protein n=1 Tax=Kitasatospora sp. NBC_00315 TaxID=2975963 RepID=UPI00325158D1
MSSSPATRTLRAAVFAALVVLLAALGQVLVTGRPLPLPVLALAGGAVFAVALALAGSVRGFWRIAAVFLPLQLALSVLFDLAQATCRPGAAPAGLHAFEPLVCRGGSVGAFLVGDGGLFGHGDRALPGAVPTAAGGLLLLLVHTVIALVAAFWLRRADAALSGLAQALRTLRDFLQSFVDAAAHWPRLLTAPVPARPLGRIPFPSASREHIPAVDVPLDPAVRRGPPALVPAC